MKLEACSHQFHNYCLHRFVDSDTEGKFLLTAGEVKKNPFYACPLKCGALFT